MEKEFKMKRAISIGWPSLIGKFRSSFLRYSHWSISEQSVWHNGKYSRSQENDLKTDNTWVAHVCIADPFLVWEVSDLHGLELVALTPTAEKLRRFSLAVPEIWDHQELSMVEKWSKKSPEIYQIMKFTPSGNCFRVTFFKRVITWCNSNRFSGGRVVPDSTSGTFWGLGRY